MLFITGIESYAQIIKFNGCFFILAGFEFLTLTFAAYFLMVQTRSAKIEERIAELEENFDVKYNGHKEGIEAFIQNLFAEFKEEMKKMFSEQFSQEEERKNILEPEKTEIRVSCVHLKVTTKILSNMEGDSTYL